MMETREDRSPLRYVSRIGSTGSVFDAISVETANTHKSIENNTIMMIRVLWF